MFLPNKCANTGKNTSQPLHFSSLKKLKVVKQLMPQFSCLAVITEKVKKISKKASLIESTAFASYRIFLIEITTICFGKVQYIPV